MCSAITAPPIPAAIRLLLQPLPLAPLSLVVHQVVKTAARRRPDSFIRLGSHAQKTFLIDPTDLPFVFRLVPRSGRPTIQALRRDDATVWHARIAGPLGALVGMVHGAMDGDALFFSRDIVFEGDTEAVLALRNALDDAEIDLVAETAATLGPAGNIAERIARRLLPLATRLTGLTLTRVDGI